MTETKRALIRSQDPESIQNNQPLLLFYRVFNPQTKPLFLDKAELPPRLRAMALYRYLSTGTMLEIL